MKPSAMLERTTLQRYAIDEEIACLAIRKHGFANSVIRKCLFLSPAVVKGMPQFSDGAEYDDSKPCEEANDEH